MLEILGIFALCNVNKKNAALRGESPGRYIGFTILLWVGLELLGAVIGFAIGMESGAYVVALLFAGVGGFISYRLAKGKGGTSGTYQARTGGVPPVKSQPSQKPAPAEAGGGGFCTACGNPLLTGARFCGKCGCSTAQPSGAAEGEPAVLPDAKPDENQLVTAVNSIFNNEFSTMVYDPDDTLWKEPIQVQLEEVVAGGRESIDIIEKMLFRCADGQGGSIREDWWNGSKWILKTVALLPQKESGEMLIRLLRKNSNIMEWFTYVQQEAVIQLANMDSSALIPDLEGILKAPFSMSPVNDIVKIIEKAGITPPQTPALILAKAENQLGDREGIEYLLSYLAESATWSAKDQGFLYYLLGHKTERLDFPLVARSYYGAQIAICPQAESLGWQEFYKDGVVASPEKAAELHRLYPIPKTMEEIETYTSILLSVSIEEQNDAPMDTLTPTADPNPDTMTAEELIDFMTTDEAEDLGLGFLGTKLSAKLKDSFYERPQDVEKALLTFGDEGKVARFNMIRHTMKPNDLDYLLPDLLMQYINSRN